MAGTRSGEYKCQKCGQTFSNENELTNHNRQEHGMTGSGGTGGGTSRGGSERGSGTQRPGSPGR